MKDATVEEALGLEIIDRELLYQIRKERFLKELDRSIEKFSENRVEYAVKACLPLSATPMLGIGIGYMTSSTVLGVLVTALLLGSAAYYAIASGEEREMQLMKEGIKMDIMKEGIKMDIMQGEGDIAR